MSHYPPKMMIKLYLLLCHLRQTLLRVTNHPLTLFLSLLIANGYPFFVGYNYISQYHAYYLLFCYYLA
ncbi:hypothetical protein Lalb_Chr06g0163101 [Lupinus albus]|uniref:Uncharacterized protein n=1 Tax=Lupinus albus TaxID=3870 RepID=A0A6A4QBZ2_LUPAL|nr:hypothetical protein Lalb_Chr06g0163101 [Lupinus albus]